MFSEPLRAMSDTIEVGDRVQYERYYLKGTYDTGVVSELVDVEGIPGAMVKGANGTTILLRVDRLTKLAPLAAGQEL